VGREPEVGFVGGDPRRQIPEAPRVGERHERAVASPPVRCAAGARGDPEHNRVGRASLGTVRAQVAPQPELLAVAGAGEDELHLEVGRRGRVERARQRERGCDPRGVVSARG
jgi:hypothetical protein